MYVGTTGGKHFIFTHFLSGNRLQISSQLFTPKVSNDILTDKIKCLHLQRCSTEAGHGKNAMLSAVEKEIIQGDLIDLSNYNLSVNELSTLVLLLLRSPKKELKSLNLSGCNIDDNSCNLLCEMSKAQNAPCKIKTVDISCNSIHWESLCKLCDVLSLWQTQELVISIDSLYDTKTMNEINSFTNKLQKGVPTHNLTGALMCTYMAKQQMLVVVYSDETRLCCCQLPDCKLDDTVVTTLNLLANYFRDIETVNNNAISFVYNIDYNEIITKSTMLSNYVDKIILCGFHMHSKGAYLIKIPLTIKKKYQKSYHHAADYLSAVLCNQSNASYLQAISVTSDIATESCLQMLSNMELFSVPDNNISKEGADDIAAVLSHNTKLRELYLGGNNLQTSGAMKIAKSLLNTSNLTTVNINNNKIGEEAADDIMAVLSNNTQLEVLELGNNFLGTVGISKIMKGLQNTSYLTSLGIGHNCIDKEAAGDVAAVLSHNNKLQELYLGRNNLQTSGIIKILRSLHNTSGLTVIDISNNNITEEAADDIAAVLSHNTKLRGLYLGGNNLQVSSAMKIAKSLLNTSNLTTVNINNNKIGEEAADDIMAVLSNNTQLEVLELGN